MSKSLDGFQVALFFDQSSDRDVEKLCESVMGTLPDSTERQKATGVTIATVTEDQVLVRFVLNPIRCDIHFSPQSIPGPDLFPVNGVPMRDLYSFAEKVVKKAADYFKVIQRIGIVVTYVQRYPSSAAALAALKKSLPFEFGVGPSSEDVVVQYNSRRSISTNEGTVEVNQLFNKSTAQAQSFQFGPDGAQANVFMVLRESLDVNTTAVGLKLAGPKLSAVVEGLFKQMSSQMPGQ